MTEPKTDIHIMRTEDTRLYPLGDSSMDFLLASPKAQAVTTLQLFHLYNISSPYVLNEHYFLYLRETPWY